MRIYFLDGFNFLLKYNIMSVSTPRVSTSIEAFSIADKIINIILVKCNNDI